MKILLITFNFAPRASSPAIRTVNLAKHLVVEGHVLEVLTYDVDTLTLFSPYDELLSRKVPDEMIITRICAGPLRRWLTKRKSRGSDVQTTKSQLSKNPVTSILIPDPHVESVVTFYKSAKQIIDRFHPDVIMTHGYPFSAHIVGYLLKKKYPEIFWVADYGDPWSGTPISELYRPCWRVWLDHKIEHHLLKYVDLVTVTTKPTKELYIRQFPQITQKIDLVPMGYDPDDFAEINMFQRDAKERLKLWCVYTGRLYSQARDPLPFFKAIESLLSKYPEINKSLSIIFVGEIEDCLLTVINRSPARGIFKIIPWVPFEESVAWMKSADYLLLFGNRGEMQIPGKIFQYMGANKPIVLFYETKQDPTLAVLEKCTSSLFVENKVDDISCFFHSLIFPQDLNGGEKIDAENKDDIANHYRWEKIVKRLIERITCQLGI